MQSNSEQLSVSEDASFEASFHTLSTSPALKIFDRKTHYSLHGPDARFVAQHYFGSLQAVRRWSSGLDYVVLRQGIEFTAVLTLVLRGNCPRRAVDVYAKEGGTWVVVRSGSPGHVAQFEAELFGDEALGGDEREAPPPTFMAVFPVQLKGKTVLGVALADTTLKQLEIAEFEDNEQLANFESALVQRGVLECATIADDKNYLIVKLHEVLERCNVALVAKKRSDFKDNDLEQDLRRLVGDARFQRVHNVLESKTAVSALACLLNHLDVMSDNAAHGAWRLRSFDLAQYMRLDAAALKALNLVAMPDDVNQRMNLSSYLDATKTSMGSRLSHQLVKQPLLDVGKIQERQVLIKAFFEDAVMRQEVRDDHLRGMPDVERLCRKLVVERATLQDLCVLYQFAMRLDPLATALKGPLDAEFGPGLKERAMQLQHYCSLIAAAIDLEKAAETHEYLIKASYSEALTKLHEGKDKYRTKIVMEHETVVDKLHSSDKKLKVEHSPKQGWYFKVSKAEEKNLRKHLVGEFQPFETSAGGVKFRSTALVQLSEKWTQYHDMYVEASRELVVRVINVAKTYLEVFEAAGALVARLDVLAAWSHVFASAPGQYVQPTVTTAETGDEIVLKGMRHPCMELQDGVTIIANDVDLRRDASEFVILTGANSGGKSSYIRSAGILVLMAQIGAMVPASEARVRVCDCILARVGAGDSQLRGVSTFMSEMLETAAILSTATSQSLIIIDELGRGTSTYDGFGLAWAISEHIAQKVRAFSFFATHFFELTALSEHIPTVHNFHVKAMTERDRLVMLYRVMPGPSDQSLGIHVAKMAQFPAAVVDAATKKSLELAMYAKPLDGVAALTTRDAEDAGVPNKRTRALTDMRTFLQEYASSGTSKEEMRTKMNALVAQNPEIHALLETQK